MFIATCVCVVGPTIRLGADYPAYSIGLIRFDPTPLSPGSSDEATRTKGLVSKYGVGS